MKIRMSDELKAMAKNPYLWRNALAIIGMASLMLPWIKLDGASGSMTGSALIAYLFTGGEKWEMLKAAPLGAISLLILPIITLFLAFAAWLRALRDVTAVGLNIAAMLAPVPILVFAGSITSSDNIMFKGVMTPQAGIVILILSQMGMLFTESYMRSGGKMPWSRRPEAQETGLTEPEAQGQRPSNPGPEGPGPERPRPQPAPEVRRREPGPAPSSSPIGDLYTSSVPEKTRHGAGRRERRRHLPTESRRPSERRRTEPGAGNAAPEDPYGEDTGDMMRTVRHERGAVRHALGFGNDPEQPRQRQHRTFG